MSGIIRHRRKVNHTLSAYGDENQSIMDDLRTLFHECTRWLLAVPSQGHHKVSGKRHTEEKLSFQAEWILFLCPNTNLDTGYQGIQENGLHLLAILRTGHYNETIGNDAEGLPCS